MAWWSVHSNTSQVAIEGMKTPLQLFSVWRTWSEEGEKSQKGFFIMMDEIQIVCMSFESGSQGTMAVVPLGNSRYRLAATPLVLFDIENVYWGDIVEAEFREDGSLYFRKIVERAPLQHKEYILHREVEESAAFALLLEEIEACGGGFEILMGGGFRCHLPHDCSLDVDSRLAEIYKSVFAKARLYPLTGQKRKGRVIFSQTII